MAAPIPDLWRAHENATRFYSLYLVRLFVNGLHEKVVAAARQIRRYAARGPGAKEGMFTFNFEIDSLCELKHFDDAWRQLRKREVVLYGKQLDLDHHPWAVEGRFDLPFYYAPIQYFRGRYRLGCTLLETWLGMWFQGKQLRSDDMLYYVYKGDKEPQDRYGVTLKHFYNHLGKDLRQWQHWPAFVNGFPPRFFRMTKVNRAEMLHDAALLPVFFDNLLVVQTQRKTTRTTWSLADLIDDPVKARKRQDRMKRKWKQLQEKANDDPARKELDEKLLEWFPELAGLPKGSLAWANETLVQGK